MVQGLLCQNVFDNNYQQGRVPRYLKKEKNMRSKLTAPTMPFATILDNTIQARVADSATSLPRPTTTWWDAENKQHPPAVISSARNFGSTAFDGGQQHVIKSRAEFRNPWGGNPLKI